MDLNHDKQIQSLLCYRYTIGQLKPRVRNVDPLMMESSFVRASVRKHVRASDALTLSRTRPDAPTFLRA